MGVRGQRVAGPVTVEIELHRSRPSSTIIGRDHGSEAEGLGFEPTVDETATTVDAAAEGTSSPTVASFFAGSASIACMRRSCAAMPGPVVNGTSLETAA